jgi:hypothetical protein
MINLLQDNSTFVQNDVVLNFSDLKKSNSTLYLFQFYENAENESVYCLAYDSASLTRYNRFTIQVNSSTASLDPTQGQIYLSSGRGKYNIWESPSGSLNPTGLNLVEGCGVYMLTGSYKLR